MKLATRLPAELTHGLFPLTLLCASLLEQRRGHPKEATTLRERGMPLLERIPLAEQSVPFHNLMSLTLIDLGEYRRAIPFCEQAVQQLVTRGEALAIADLLVREGTCYNRCGLHMQGAVPLRAAVDILRRHPGDPRLPSALIALGNAVRNAAPAEAEASYKEAASIHEAKAQLESATAAWVNLGIVCSRQGRHDEAIAWYERALRVREASPGTPVARIALLLNNMANARRRMRQFDEALRLVDRALELLKNGDGAALASAYGTRGEILHDAGNHVEAVQWLEKSCAERRKMSSPDLEALAEILACQIDSLRALGRLDEASAAEQRLAEARAAQAAPSQNALNLSELGQQAPGTVMVELPFGGRAGNRFELRDAEIVAEQIGAILAMRNAGRYGGRIVIPESTTLWFYGEDADAIYRAMEQYLTDHAVCAGAVVAIRQGTSLRELVVPQVTN
jgi:tetratricopeptide (TPR) repeat protein